MTAASAARWSRIIRRLVRDAASWSRAVGDRMGTGEVELRVRLASEAVGLAACLMREHLRQQQVAEADQQALADELRREWEAWLDREQVTAGMPALPPGAAGDAPGSLSYPTDLMPAVAGPSAQELALEFQRATGLAADALVGDGHNLVALVFYHRVFLAARAHPSFTAAHRAEIVRAARQCRERFQRTLRRAPDPGAAHPWLPQATLPRLLSLKRVMPSAPEAHRGSLPLRTGVAGRTPE